MSGKSKISKEKIYFFLILFSIFNFTHLLFNQHLFAEGTTIVEDEEDEKRLMENHAVEKLRFGLANHIHYYKIKKTKNTVVEQRSGRKRLYDHNLLLRALFRDKLIHKKYGSLGSLFEGATFIDFGSAILYEEGAVTVRDLYEDTLLQDHLSKIVATDINDTEYDHTRYIEIHIKEREPFPFAFNEIPVLIDDPEYIRILTKIYAKSEFSPIIFRSTNSGPDLFYTVEEMKDHFLSILTANPNRNILYFFNRFIFFRSACATQFQLIGTIDERIGVNHSFSAWRYVDWNKRSLEEAFRPNLRYIRLVDESRLSVADRLDASFLNQSCFLSKTLRFYGNKIKKSITKS
ncbi:hypothetical protein LPTSP3_g35320 [Leptospira kobayashii]|uniref:Lipoprotein n=1 Tax=Leptospira kobayashii TaxID=1917830 RepID=A0ABN6KH82_9LEPT|nr:hypothetical protein [Leptospira kobayashii]BDA80602.1 hypothetical protein LPTSP3_g35320 [Leptospira kobayashii]